MTENMTLFTEDEVARMLKLSVKTLQQKRSAGKPPAFVKLDGGAVRYVQGDLLQYIEESRVALKGTNDVHE